MDDKILAWREKYQDMQLQMIDVLSITDPEEAGFLMCEIDVDIAEADEVLTVMKARATGTSYYTPAKEYGAAVRDLKDLKVARNAMQERRGFLVRQAKRDEQNAWQNRFIGEARRILPHAQFIEIMDATKIGAPK